MTYQLNEILQYCAAESVARVLSRDESWVRFFYLKALEAHHFQRRLERHKFRTSWTIHQSLIETVVDYGIIMAHCNISRNSYMRKSTWAVPEDWFVPRRLSAILPLYRPFLSAQRAYVILCNIYPPLSCALSRLFVAQGRTGSVLSFF